VSLYDQLTACQVVSFFTVSPLARSIKVNAVFVYLLPNRSAKIIPKMILPFLMAVFQSAMIEGGGSQSSSSENHYFDLRQIWLRERSADNDALQQRWEAAVSIFRALGPAHYSSS
jgi:hypothetical protein